jgi:hypothetical protein
MAYLKYGLVPGGNGTVSLFSDPSYTVRACNVFLEEFPISNYDSDYHTYYQQKSDGKWEVSNEYYFNNSIPAFGTAFVKNQENWVYAGINQGTLNTYTQLVANTQNQFQLETGIPVNNNSNGNYDDGISIPINGTVQFETVYKDNLLEGPFNTGTHYIEIPLWDLPGTANTPTIDLSASTITFSSSETLDPANTVTIPFNSAQLEIPIIDAGTADHLWKVNRNVLTNQSIVGSGSVDLTSLKRIKFNIVSSGAGAFVFKTGQIKMVPASYSHNYANVNTKTGVLARETWPTIAQNHMPVLIQDGLKVKDFTYISKFSFKAPPTSGTTELSMFGRVNPEFTYGTAGTATAAIIYPSGSVYPNTNIYPANSADNNAYLRSQLLIDSNSVQIILYEDHLGNLDNNTFEISFDQVLTAGEYYFVTRFKGDKWESILYSSDKGSSIGKAIVLETGLQSISNPWLKGSTTNFDLGKGYAGYQFKPTEYGGFALDYIYSKEAVLAEYESKTFNSYTPVKSVSLFPTSVPDLQLLSGNLLDFERVRNTNNFNFSGKTESGFIATPQDANLDDVVIEEDTVVYYNSKSLKVTKKEDAKIAAIQYGSKLTVNDFSKLIFKTKLRYNDLLNVGEFRIVFWNESRTKVLYMEKIKGLVPNEWNNIDIPLYTNILLNNQFIFEIGHYGEIEPVPPITDPYGYFWLEDTQLTLESVEWEASNNDGKTYVPFLDAINGEYKSVNFASQNYYTSIINKNPYILWEFNDTNVGAILPKEDATFTFGQLLVAGNVVTTGNPSVDDYLINTPGTAVGGSAYAIPSSVKKFQNNKAIAIYGTVDSHIRTEGTADLGTILGIPASGSSDITASIRFYTDTINKNISLVSCDDPAVNATNSWNFYLENTNNLVFKSHGVGTITATVSSWNDQEWHTACFSYNTTGNIINLYWDGDLVATDNLSSDLIFDFQLKTRGPELTVPYNTYNNFNSNRPFLFVDNISVHKQVIDQNEIYKDNIAAISEYNKIKVKAKAYTTNAWIYGYEIIPNYAKMGKLKENINKSVTVSDSFSATENSPQQDGIIFDQAIFDVSTFGND